jgi:hypothetical protein
MKISIGLSSAASLLVGLLLSACSSDQLKNTAYEAAYQKECLDRAGTPDCDPAHSSYDEYSAARREQLK